MLTDNPPGSISASFSRFLHQISSELCSQEWAWWIKLTFISFFPPDLTPNCQIQRLFPYIFIDSLISSCSKLGWVSFKGLFLSGFLALVNQLIFILFPWLLLQHLLYHCLLDQHLLMAKNPRGSWGSLLFCRSLNNGISCHRFRDYLCESNPLACFGVSLCEPPWFRQSPPSFPPGPPCRLPVTWAINSVTHSNLSWFHSVHPSVSFLN